MKIKKPYLVAAGVALLTLLCGLAYWISVTDKPAEVAAEATASVCKPIKTVTVASDDFTFGPANAPITLVEYASQTCSHCAAFHQDVFPQLQENYIKPGLVRFVFREFQRNRVDLAASVLGRCLGHDKFIPFTDSLLENQAVWMGREDQNIVAGLKEMAHRAGMSDDEFDACLNKQDEAKHLADVREKAMKDYCLEGTPTLLLNGRKLPPEAQEYEGLDSFLREELKKLGAKSPAPPAVPPASAKSGQ